ncbi:MIT C-terminal domain-containing protein [Aeromonas salmonicida]|uniref:MIT C-terminal domain-containing protein n=1 Tax=Aeromonas salmonicida TaxID=645 RepID=UPI0031FC2B57
MLCSFTHDGIDEMILDPEINSSTNCFKFVISDELVNYIEFKYKNDITKLHIFQNWIASRFQQKNRLRMIAESDVSHYYTNPQNEEIFISCALFSGHFLFGNKNSNIDYYYKHGIHVHDIAKSAEFHGMGDNPIYEERLNRNGCKTPIELMRYFIGESNLVFIDNYFNHKALSFIEYIADGLDAPSNITIITRKNALRKLSRVDIITQLSKRKINHNIKILTLNNDKEFHDRHIVIGNRLFIDASAGLDAYSFHGEWENRECKFSVYDIYDNATVRTFDTSDDMNNTINISIKIPT